MLRTFSSTICLVVNPSMETDEIDVEVQFRTQVEVQWPISLSSLVYWTIGLSLKIPITVGERDSIRCIGIVVEGKWMLLLQPMKGR